MNIYLIAPIWDKAKCTMTTSLAKPTETKQTQEVGVIKTTGGMYRNSLFESVFLLGKAVQCNRRQVRLEAYCRWFGHRLKSSVGIKIQFDLAKSEIINNYSGVVINNLAIK